MSSAPASKLRILVIDDNPQIHADFIKVLTKDKSASALEALDQELFGSEASSEDLSLPEFQIDTASQGQEGVECIKKAAAEGNQYALAFVDVRMPPGWDGIETIKHIWELDKNIQIVICTAYSDYTWEETVQQLGMTDNLLILKKPFDNVAVRQLACALTKKWQLMRAMQKHQEWLEQRVAERTNTLERSVSVLRSTLESSSDGILVVDKNDKIVDYNNRYVEMWNIPPSVLETKDSNIVLEYVADLLQEPDKFFAKVTEYHEHPDDINVDVIKLKDGRIYERYMHPHKLKGKTIGRVVSFHDITRRAYLEEKLGYQATHDPLTDLPNRVLLVDRLLEAIESAERNNKIFGVLFLDLDRFKLINDSLSHAAGDELLKIVALRLRSVIRKEDTLARLGGDEFVLVLNDLRQEDDAYKIVDKLLDTFKPPFMVEGHEISITASIGVCFYPENGKKIDELLRNADLAMYRAKAEGANQSQHYTPELSQRTREYFDKDTELRRALDNHEFFLCYQPQFNLETKELIALEALIRWNHPKKGVILPIDFIPIAEESGLIIPIGEWVIRTASAQLKKLHDEGLPRIYVSVNVGGKQFKLPNFAEVVQNILKDVELEPQYLEIEITENVIINNNDIINTINTLKNVGVKIALDDFGTGNTTLNYLRKIPIDHLKLDKSYVDNINLDRDDEVIIQAIAMIAHGLNLEVVAEGVEKESHIEFLSDKQYQVGQGFYFSKPLPAEEVEAFLRAKSLMQSK